MLFMIIERFKDGTAQAAGERFKARGRLMPANVKYVASWLEHSGATCFQVMDSPDRASLDVWIDNWKDLVNFEVVEVQTSAEFWTLREAGS